MHSNSYRFSSTAIQEVLDRTAGDKNTAVVFFYFDFRDSEKQTTAGMLSSVISQLITKAASAPAGFFDFYGKHQQTQPSLAALTQLVVDLCKQCFQTVYIFVDALDECKERTVLMATLRDLISKKAMSFMVTSRAEDDIIKEFSSTSIAKVGIDSEAASKDVELFVTMQIKAEAYLCSLGQDLKDEITASLVNGAKGM